MNYITRFMSVILVLGIFVSEVNAEQTRFSYSSIDNGTLFEYQWIDGTGASKEVTFTLSSDALNAAPTVQPNYRSPIMMRHMVVALQKEAQSYDPRDAIVRIIPSRDNIDIEVKARQPARQQEVISAMNMAHKDAYNAYLFENYYMEFTTSFNQKGIKPDHARYILETTEALIPASQAFYEKLVGNEDARAYLNTLLGWVQSIPYDPLNDRLSSNGAGFAPPMGLLLQNKGDCDSKAVLTSALVRAFLPDTSMIMVFLPKHALLGVAINPLAHEETLVVNDEIYVLYEPTGPALIPFGQVSESTKRQLLTGRYTTETVN